MPISAFGTFSPRSSLNELAPLMIQGPWANQMLTMQSTQYVIISIHPSRFDDVIRELVRRGTVIHRRLRDLGVITAEVSSGGVRELLTIPGVQDVEVEESPFSEGAIS